MPITNTHRRIKTTIRNFLADRRFFDDEALVRLLDMARAGQLSYAEQCRCLVGMSSKGYFLLDQFKGRMVEIAEEAEHAFGELGHIGSYDADDAEVEQWPSGTDWCVIMDAKRNRRLVPMILREIRARSRQPAGQVARLSIAPATKFQFVD